MTEPARGTSLGATVAVGVVAGGAAALAGSRTWATLGDTGDLGGSVAAVAVGSDWPQAPLVTAVALVGLATWGVVLVTRGRFRRVMTWFGMIVATALLVTSVAYWWSAPGALEERLGEYGASEVDVQRTWWSWLGGAGAVLAVLAAWVAVREAAHWPEMGRRYDAPGVDDTERADGADDGDREGSERSNIDLWKSIDEGRDPTD